MGQVDIVVRREGHFQRVYALKRLHSVYADDPEVRAMFVDEARIAGLIRHTNVVGVLDAGEDEEGPFLVMDYVEGVSASQLARHAEQRSEMLPIAVAVEVVRQVALGLHAAHETCGPGGIPLDVVHRDVSPQNILVGFDGVARVTDFGVARALDRQTQTAVGALKGKAGYLSPEQLRYEELDRRSDLFSLGVVLHELITGERLYAGDRPATFRRILEEPPPRLRSRRPETPESLEAIVLTLLAKTPGARFATARELADRLELELRALTSRGMDVDLARYLDVELAAQREEQRAWIAEALASGDLPAPPAPQHSAERGPIAPQARRMRPWLLVPAAALLLAGIGSLVAAIALTEEGAEPRVVIPSAPAPAPPARPVAEQVAPPPLAPAVAHDPPAPEPSPPEPADTRDPARAVEPPPEPARSDHARARARRDTEPLTEPVGRAPPSDEPSDRPRLGEMVGREYFPR